MCRREWWQLNFKGSKKISLGGLCGRKFKYDNLTQKYQLLIYRLPLALNYLVYIQSSFTSSSVHYVLMQWAIPIIWAGSVICLQRNKQDIASIWSTRITLWAVNSTIARLVWWCICVYSLSINFFGPLNNVYFCLGSWVVHGYVGEYVYYVVRLTSNYQNIQI